MAGIEALAALGSTVREDLFGDAWSEMWGMRNRIAHGYLLVEPGIVRSTVQRDVPNPIATMRQAMQRLT